MKQDLESSLKIAFISSALSPEGADDRESFDFFAVLLSSIVRRAQEAGHRVSVFIPQKQGPDGSDQAKLVADVMKQAHDFDAIVIAPFKVDVVKRELVKGVPAFTSRDKGETYKIRPLVLVDKMVDLPDFQRSLAKAFVVQNVTCSQEEGGYKAAEVLVNALRKLPGRVANKRALILRGLEGDAERVAGFKRYMFDKEPSITVVEAKSTKLNFTRLKASEWMNDQIDDLWAGRPCTFGKLDGKTVWGIFAANDEMALGVRSSVSGEYQRRREGFALSTHSLTDIHYSSASRQLREIFFLQNLRIVGFDGIARVVDLIKSRETFGDRGATDDRWLIGTVRAEMQKQSTKAIEWVESVARRDAVPSSVGIILPTEVIS